MLELATAAALALVTVQDPATERAARDEQHRAEDLRQLWGFVRDNYCFFEQVEVDWAAALPVYEEKARAAETQADFLHVLEGLLDELNDPHCMLNTNAPSSWRPFPHEIWAEWIDGAAVVTAVRAGSGAERAGVRPGLSILGVRDVGIEEAVTARLDPLLLEETSRSRAWALLSVLAGRHEDMLRIDVSDADEGVTTIEVPGGTGATPMVTSSLLQGDVGYVRIATFGEDGVVAAVDSALARMRSTKGLILDVRANAGGDTAIARPIMGRFVSRRTAYAKMARREGARLSRQWTEYVEPRGPWTYDRPVVVLVDRFSVSMAEGFAMGMRGLGVAEIVGTKTAGLGAAVGAVVLRHSGIRAQISAEPVYDVHGKPRWEMRPDVEVGADGEDADDPVLAAGQARLAEILAGRDR